MKLGTACASILLGLVSVTAANAADLARGYGGMKDHRGGIPVPAPIPVQETFRYYLRADIGLGIKEEPGMSERGLTYGATDSLAPFGTSSSWFSSDFDTFVLGGLGAGMYFSPHLRGDITVDWRNANEVEAAGSYSYAQQSGVPLAPTGNTVNGSVREHNTLRDTLGLVNLYWDITERGRFTPYIGIGAGFVLRDVDRRYTASTTVVDGTGALVSGPTTVSASSKAAEIAPAAAAMAGASYAISPGVLIDLNYRFTWLGSIESTTFINGVPSRLTVGDTYEHALRAGVRWNVW